MAYKTIMIAVDDETRYEGTVATGQTITPGQIIEETSAGIRQVATAGGTAVKAFAVENASEGGDITETYTAGNICQYIIPDAGDQVYAWLAAGEKVVVGDFLENDTGGALRKVVEQDTLASGFNAIATGNVVARVVEALDNGASGAVAARLRVQII